MTSAARRRDFSVTEMLAALVALERGEFTATEQTIHPGRRRPQRRGEHSQTSIAPVIATGAFPGPTVLVVAAHPGAGASSIAVLLADTAAAAGPARLIDCAPPTRSGVAATTDAELGEDGAGWRHARRRALLVDRPVADVDGVDDVAGPQPAPAMGSASITVVDAGWSAWALLHATGWINNLLHTAHLVLVCRPTVPGVRQLEQLLAALPGPEPVIAAIGATKWPGQVTGSCGPLLRSARTAGRVVPVPFDRGLDVAGATSAPMPKPVAAAGQHLAARLFPDTRRTSSHRQRWAG